MSCDNCDCNNGDRPTIQRIEIEDWETGILEITTRNTDGPR